MLLVFNLNIPLNDISCESAYVMHNGEWGCEQVEILFDHVETQVTGNSWFQIVLVDCSFEGYPEYDLVEFLKTAHELHVMLCFADDRPHSEARRRAYASVDYGIHHEAYFYGDDGRIVILPPESFPVSFFFCG